MQHFPTEVVGKESAFGGIETFDIANFALFPNSSISETESRLCSVVVVVVAEPEDP
jgi:hypothetical protein